MSLPQLELAGGWVLFDDEMVVHDGERTLTLDVYVRETSVKVEYKYVCRDSGRGAGIKIAHIRRPHATRQGRCRSQAQS